MQRKPLVLLLIVSLCSFGLLFARYARSQKDKSFQAKVVKLVSAKKDSRVMDKIKTDEPEAAISKKSNAVKSSARQDVIFADDFEGGKPRWQPGATWGIRATTNGNADEDRSDWELVTNNSHSPTRSWHETNVTSLSTDMLMSPAFTLPTTITGGAPLARVNMDFWVDWDAIVPASNRVYVFFGLDSALWAVDTSDPGAGAKSWVAHNSGTPPFDVFSRQFLTTPEINLTSAQAPITLSFLYKSISEQEFDYNKVDIFTADDNFASYRSVASFDGPAGSAGGGTATWTSHSVNLDAYAGKVIKIRFSENGDFGFVEPNAIFALDEITVAGAGGQIFKDDGGDTPSNMAAEGFAPGNPVQAFSGVSNPAPNWINVAVPGNLLLTGGSGTLAPGDRTRIGILFAYHPFNTPPPTPPPPGRGLYIDDINLVGETIQDDVAAVSVAIPFPAKVGDALTFALNVANNGVNPQSGVQWQGTITNAATGAQVATVVGRRTAPIQPDSTAAIPSITTWTPAAPGVYRIRAFTRLANDEDRSNDTTRVARDDGNGTDGFGDQRYSPFVVCEQNVLFSAALWNAPASPTPVRLLAAGFVLRSAPAPGVVTWQTTQSALVPEGNGLPNYSGAYILFDSLGRPQDEELIIPNLDFSFVTSNATLAFKALGSGGFPPGYTRFSVSVSGDGGGNWVDLLERRRGVDPQTGQNFGGPAIFTLNLRPAVLDITRWAAGRSNVWIRFRYEGFNDGDWLFWGVSVCGRGLQAANLTGVTDIPDDQGKQVRLSWTRSPNDGQLQGVPIAQYGIWRQVAGSNTVAPLSGEVIQVKNRSAMIGNIQDLKPGTRFYEIETAQGWDFIGSVLAHSDPDYNFVAPTLADSAQTCFMVSAHTANPSVFANSNTACGTSFDNLPPDAPGNLAATNEDGTALLAWEEPANEEPAFYSIYRSETSGSYGNPFATTTDRQYRVDRNTKYYYVVAATDYGSNRSAFSNEVLVLVTGVDDRHEAEIPTAYALGQNYPNPFNPQTTIKFDLVERGKVTLTIYDMMGQEVEKLVAAEMEPGYHQVVWDAKNVPSGVYFYRLTVNNFTQLRKMVLMK